MTKRPPDILWITLIGLGLRYLVIHAPLVLPLIPSRNYFWKPHDPNEPVDALRCPTCGYSLIGLTEPRCPECGQQFRVPT